MQEQKLEKTFEFITVNDPAEHRSTELRKKVKRHVMKDIGLSRRRPKKNPIVLDVVLDPRAHVGSTSTDPFFPRELQDNERELVNSIFRDDYDNGQRAFRNEWFPLGQIDPAIFNIILSNAASYIDQRAGFPHGQRSLEAEKYHLLALQSLNQRLANPNVEITDGLIGAVTGFIVHNEVIADFKQWAVHHAGVVRLVAMRGGINSIHFRELRETLSWIETRGCFPQDRRPFFPLPPTWIDRIQRIQRQFPAAEIPVELMMQWNNLAPSSSDTFASYANLFYFSAYASHNSHETEGQIWLKDERTGNWTTVLIHTLTDRYGDEQRSRERIPTQEVIRLASLLYLANIWRKYGTGPVRSIYLAKKLLKLHTEYDIDWQGSWRIQAWTLLMAVIETGGDMRRDLLDKLREVANAKRISVQDVILQAKKVLWQEDALPSIDTVLFTEPMDWTVKCCLKDGVLEMPWDMSTVSAGVQYAFAQEEWKSPSP